MPENTQIQTQTQGTGTGDQGTGNQGAGVGDQGTGQGQQQPVSYDEWIKTQSPEIKTMLEQRSSSLLNTVQATRRERDDLSRQLKEAAKGLEAGSEARKAMESMSAQLEAAEQRAVFYEEAGRPEIGCTNPRLAYIAAQQDQLIDARGRINWDGLRSAYPELFRRAAPTTNAGAGTQNTQPATGGMNAFIRRAAGRQ